MASGKMGSRKLLGEKCKDCGTILTKDNSRFKNGYLQTCCIPCDRIRDTKRPSRTSKARSDQYIKWRFDLDPIEYAKMLAAQNGKCEICREECSVRNRLAVDHCHRTGKIRALLCHNCNVTLGLVKEDPFILICMIQYIRVHGKH